MKVHRITRERHQDRILAVEGGQVTCPRRGVVDIERCWMCPAYGGLSETYAEGVVCKANLLDQMLDIHTALP